jgi:hypothetical protein
MGWFTLAGDPSNATWESITAPTGSLWQDIKNNIDNMFLGTLSPQQRQTIDNAAISDINQAAAGNTELANSETTQYKSGVAAAVYNDLPAGIDNYLASIEKYLPWIAGGLILVYLLPIISRVTR